MGGLQDNQKLCVSCWPGWFSTQLVLFAVLSLVLDGFDQLFQAIFCTANSLKAKHCCCRFTWQHQILSLTNKLPNEISKSVDNAINRITILQRHDLNLGQRDENNGRYPRAFVLCRPTPSVGPITRKKSQQLSPGGGSKCISCTTPLTA